MESDDVPELLVVAVDKQCLSTLGLSSVHRSILFIDLQLVLVSSMCMLYCSLIAYIPCIHLLIITKGIMLSSVKLSTFETTLYENHRWCSFWQQYWYNVVSMLLQHAWHDFEPHIKVYRPFVNYWQDEDSSSFLTLCYKWRTRCFHHSSLNLQLAVAIRWWEHNNAKFVNGNTLGRHWQQCGI